MLGASKGKWVILSRDFGVQEALLIRRGECIIFNQELVIQVAGITRGTSSLGRIEDIVLELFDMLLQDCYCLGIRD